MLRESSPINIGPYHLAKWMKFPPVFQAIGTEDEAFDSSQVVSFHQLLRSTGVESKMVILDDMGHSFDMKAVLRDNIHNSVIIPAVDFAEQFA